MPLGLLKIIISTELITECRWYDDNEIWILKGVKEAVIVYFSLRSQCALEETEENH
jgi:hypothetical protein